LSELLDLFDFSAHQPAYSSLWPQYGQNCQLFRGSHGAPDGSLEHPT